MPIDSHFAVARYLRDGRIDRSFGSSGSVILDRPYGRGDQITQLHLRCDRSTRQTDPNVPKDNVISYSPTGSVPEGTTIHLVVSSGREQRFVPNVVCETVDAAKADLRAQGFVPIRAGNASNPACPTPGMVAEQFPPSPDGKTKRPVGSTVRLYVVPQPTPTPSPSPTTPSPSPTQSESPSPSPT